MALESSQANTGTSSFPTGIAMNPGDLGVWITLDPNVALDTKITNADTTELIIASGLPHSQVTGDLNDVSILKFSVDTAKTVTFSNGTTPAWAVFRFSGSGLWDSIRFWCNSENNSSAAISPEPTSALGLGFDLYHVAGGSGSTFGAITNTGSYTQLHYVASGTSGYSERIWAFDLGNHSGSFTANISDYTGHANGKFQMTFGFPAAPLTAPESYPVYRHSVGSTDGSVFFIADSGMGVTGIGSSSFVVQHAQSDGSFDTVTATISELGGGFYALVPDASLRTSPGVNTYVIVPPTGDTAYLVEHVHSIESLAAIAAQGVQS